jgi:hypothetical protein
MQKVFTSKDYFSKLLIRQRCREKKGNKNEKRNERNKIF